MKVHEKVIELIEKEKIIVIVRNVEKGMLLPLCNAMYEGGIRLLELTYSADGKISDEENAENIRMLAKNFDGKMFIGSGTTLSEKQVQLTRDAGGQFIISPDANISVIKKTRELGMVSMPGALTPSEIQAAHLAGADFVKLFPITSLGTEYVKAITAPLSHIKFTAVGGINENNMEQYLRVGVSGFGIGANIVDKKLLTSGDFNGIKNLAEKYVSEVKKWQSI